MADIHYIADLKDITIVVLLDMTVIVVHTAVVMAIAYLEYV